MVKGWSINRMIMYPWRRTRVDRVRKFPCATGSSVPLVMGENVLKSVHKWYNSVRNFVRKHGIIIPYRPIENEAYTTIFLWRNRIGQFLYRSLGLDEYAISTPKFHVNSLECCGTINKYIPFKLRFQIPGMRMWQKLESMFEHCGVSICLNA